MKSLSDDYLGSQSGAILLIKNQGKIIVGIDEVGRGAWAGPLLVGAVALRADAPEGVADSKLLSPARREYLARHIKAAAAGIGLGWVSAAQIDEIGLAASLRLASRRAVAALECSFDLVVIDGTINFLPEFETITMPKADHYIPEVSMASIVAKVARDAYMSRLHRRDSRYGFDRHVGYGTAIHAANLSLHGPSPAHRYSFDPVRKALSVNG